MADADVIRADAAGAFDRGDGFAVALGESPEGVAFFDGVGAVAGF